MSERRSQILRFKLLMEAFIERLRKHSRGDQMYGFDEGLMRDLNALADSIGWCVSPEVKMPFWRRGPGDEWLTIFDARNGGSAGTSVIIALPDDVKHSLGGELRDGRWQYPDGRVQDYFAERRKEMIDLLHPLFQSWLVKADEALLTEDSL